LPHQLLPVFSELNPDLFSALQEMHGCYVTYICVHK